MKHESESPEIESAIERLSARPVRPHPLSRAAEERILARLERAFENVDHTDLELAEPDRPATISRRPVTIAAVAAVLVLISLSAAFLLNNGSPDPPANPPANASDEGAADDEPSAVGNPLVDIGSRLTDHGDLELFRVNSDTAAYWRVTTLPEFDGRTFRLPKRPLDRVGDNEPTPQGRRIRQQIQIVDLTDQMIPAAADVYQVAPNQNVRLNFDTGTLLKLTDLVAGEQFTIVSFAPDVTPDELRLATTGSPPDTIFVELPNDLSLDIVATAADVTAGQTNDYDRLIALQNWFLDNFEYSTEIPAGHGTDAIERFLETRRGYCEQFAATFAVMARTLGIPSRVAVGYTPGLLQTDGWYVVTGRNSHAWPEIWFDGIGWIPFEPTPARTLDAARVLPLEPTPTSSQP